MRSRVPALVSVTVFAVAVALVAVLAGRGGDAKLVKLPVASLGGASADEAAGAGLASRRALAYPGPMEYRVEGALPDLPTTAPGYRIGASTTVAAVARLAASLGLAGDVREDADGWLVLDTDRELRVQRLPGLPWSVGVSCQDVAVRSDGGDDVASCAVAVGTPLDGKGGAVSGSSGSAGGCPAEGCVVTGPGACEPGTPCTAPAVPGCEGPTVRCLPPVPACPENAMCATPVLPAPVPAPECASELECVPPELKCAPDEPCAVPGPPPTGPPVRPVELPPIEDARRLATDVFTRIGAGTDGLVIEDGWVNWQARVETTVDGLEVLGMGTSLSIGPKNAIVGGNGFLAVPDRIGDYPLVGLDAGLKRLTDGGTGSGGVRGPQTLVAPSPDGPLTKDIIESVPDVDVEGCGDPAVSCVAPTVPVPVVQVVTGARLALLHTGNALVPAYVFELSDGGTVPVPAVTDEWLDTDVPTITED